MSAELLRGLDAVSHRVSVLAAQDAELRSHLRALAQAILGATGEPPAITPVQAVPQEERLATSGGSDKPRPCSSREVMIPSFSVPSG